MSDTPVNFRLSENNANRCANCQKGKYDSEQRAYCMLGQADSTPPEQGRRVNANFVCDLFATR